MKIIDKSIEEALHRLSLAKKNKAEMSRYLGLSPQHINKIFNHKTLYFTDDVWGKIELKLKPYINDVQIDTCYDKTFPVVSEAAAASCSGNIYMPLADCIEENAEDEHVSFPCGKPGDFAIRVSGTSMMPWYPPGTLLLVRPNERIQTGKRVVAILDNGDVIFKVFIESKINIGLVSIDNDGKDYIFAKAESKHEIRSLFRVIASMRVEDDIDTAMTEAGIHHRWEDKLKKIEENN